MAAGHFGRRTNIKPEITVLNTDAKRALSFITGVAA